MKSLIIPSKIKLLILIALALFISTRIAGKPSLIIRINALIVEL
jgi:hypothetical protein